MIATTSCMFRIIGATPYVRETSISFFGVCEYNKLIKFKEANLVFADVSGEQGAEGGSMAMRCPASGLLVVC